MKKYYSNATYEELKEEIEIRLQVMRAKMLQVDSSTMQRSSVSSELEGSDHSGRHNRFREYLMSLNHKHALQEIAYADQV